MKSPNFMKASVLVLTLLVSALFFAMLKPYVITILMAAISAGLANPLYVRMVRWMGGRRQLAAGLTLLLVLIAVIVPIVSVLGMAAEQAIEVSTTARPWIQDQLSKPDPLGPLFDRLNLDALKLDREDVLTKAAATIQDMGSFFVGRVAGLTTGTVMFLFHLFLFGYCLFFMLLNGREVLRTALYYLPLTHEDEMLMIGRFTSVARAMVKGTLAIGVVQGVLGGLGFAVAGIPGSVFFGVVMVVLSIIPGIGTALLWVPAVIALIIGGHMTTAILLGLWILLVVGSVDNVLRPVMVGRDTQMSQVLILFGTLGGLGFFGLAGLLLGPMLAAAFTTLWEIYGVVFHDDLPGPGPSTAVADPGDQG